jgi:pimeloyl-ACP methyl ester carboxylesterase
MIGTIHRARPDLPVHIVAHSLGARVALTALETAPPGVLSRMILMSGAEYRGAAERALSLPAAARCHVLNVTSRENAAFDLMFRLAVPPARALDRPLSAGLGHMNGCTDLAIDHDATRAALGALGHRLAPAIDAHLPLVGLHAPGPFRRLPPHVRPARAVVPRHAAPRALPSPHENWGASQRFSPHQTGPRDCILGRAFTGVGDRPAGIRTLGTPPSGF